MHKRRLKIFWKVFLMTMSVLCFMIVVSYMLLYLLLPDFYKNYKMEQYQNLTNDFVRQFETITDFGEETGLLSLYAQQNGIDLELRNEENELLYRFYQNNYMIMNWETEEFSSEVLEASVELSGDRIQDYENVSIECHYQTKDGTNRLLTLMIPLQPLNEAKEVMIRIYPAACVICLFFAFLFALVFSKIYIKPILRISNLTRKMSELEENVEIPVCSSDEIGELSQDINHLYQELKGTIDTLRTKIDGYSASENRKINFLRTVSHELKTPLAAANALIEGVIYEIPPYHTDQKRYLSECKQFLEKAVDLVKESLSLSNVEYGEKEKECNLIELIHEVKADYVMITRSKQIKYEEELPADIILWSRTGLLKKAISNIISNAVSYTPNKGRIRVAYKKEEGVLTIENTCIPLSVSELSKMFEPFYSGENGNQISNGLGLSIVKQIFQMLHIRYEFLPSEEEQGMKFSIYIK